ncbi:MAG TPA: dihydrodipicolinate reductase, partial [Mycobacterium sp.]|nr:dihydrodipicolinate reductase [Mycobacterium sp.]
MPGLRVIPWGTGAVGTEILTAIIDHRTDLEIVGARVYSADKDGADVGALVGRDPIGVTATTDVAKIMALDADCVLYTPRNTDIDEVCAILASGKNVATTAFLFHPQRSTVADRERLLGACRAGDSTVHGSGLNPGNLSGVLPLALSGMSRTIDKITLQERADWSAYDSTAITFDNMAFGQPVED